MEKRGEIVEALWVMAQYFEHKEPSMRVAQVAGFLETPHAEDDDEAFRVGTFCAVLENGWDDNSWPDDRDVLADVLRVLYYVMVPYIEDPELDKDDILLKGEAALSRVASIRPKKDSPEGVHIRDIDGDAFVVMADPSCALAQMVVGLAGLGAPNIGGVCTPGGEDERSSPRLMAEAFGIQSIGSVDDGIGTVIKVGSREDAVALLEAFGYPGADADE